MQENTVLGHHTFVKSVSLHIILSRIVCLTYKTYFMAATLNLYLKFIYSYNNILIIRDQL